MNSSHVFGSMGCRKTSFLAPRWESKVRSLGRGSAKPCQRRHRLGILEQLLSQQFNFLGSYLKDTLCTENRQFTEASSWEITDI